MEQVKYSTYMKKIQMVDLQGQYERIRNQVQASFEEVLSTTAFINGPQVQQFQKELEAYMGVKHVIPCANGTDALQIAMMGLGLKEGDEVITADFTFAATVEVIALLKLTPVLVDVYDDTFNINIEAIEKAITPRTKAIVPVHLFGQPANMAAVMALAKNLGCYGDGGAIFTNDDELAYTLRGIVNHGMYVRYHHDVVGVNSRLDSLQAAVLRAKLPHLDDYNNSRREAARKYTEALQGNANIITPVIAKGYDHVFHQYTLRITNGKRDALAKVFADNGVPFGIYYPIPLHAQKAYTRSSYNEADFAVTNQLVQEVISLPMHTELEDEQIAFITDLINKTV